MTMCEYILEYICKFCICKIAKSTHKPKLSTLKYHRVLRIHYLFVYLFLLIHCNMFLFFFFFLQSHTFLSYLYTSILLQKNTILLLYFPFSNIQCSCPYRRTNLRSIQKHNSKCASFELLIIQQLTHRETVCRRCIKTPSNNIFKCFFFPQYSKQNQTTDF